jgi:hypothetical protein
VGPGMGWSTPAFFCRSFLVRLSTACHVSLGDLKNGGNNDAGSEHLSTNMFAVTSDLVQPLEIRIT